MNHSKRASLHIYLLLGSFALALGLRLIRLGVTPLGDLEAVHALQAWAVARGTGVAFGPFAAYVGLTAPEFYLFTSGIFLARFWPALIGALIVFVPCLFKEKLGLWPATLASFVLALSPEMVGLSRIIGSPMMALVLLLLAIGLFMRQKPILSGMCLSLALMSGPGFWIGGLILAVSFLVSEVLFKVSAIIRPPDSIPWVEFWGRFGTAFGVALLVVGTGFFLAPANLSGVFGGLVDFLRGFVNPGGTTILFILLALAGYALQALLLGLWGGIRAILVRHKLDLFLFVWSLVGMVFILLYPGRGTPDVIWVTFPLWLLSVRVICLAWRTPEHSRMISVGTAILIVIIFSFMLLAFRTLIGASLEQGQQLTFLLALLGGVVLLVAIILLVSYGWSQEVALPGLLMGLAVLFVLSSFALSIRTTGLSSNSSYELWYPEQAYVSTEWLRKSLDQVTGWNAGVGTPVEIAVSDFDTPAMRWFLRHDEPVNFVPYLPPQTQPGILITGEQEVPEISNSYRGQSLTWSRKVLWEELTPFQYLRWMITREAPVQSNPIIFWVRTDLMPDGQFSQ